MTLPPSWRVVTYLTMVQYDVDGRWVATIYPTGGKWHWASGLSDGLAKTEAQALESAVASWRGDERRRLEPSE